jgi:glycosyltransferase involved in cell wall biosynthesis
LEEELPWIILQTNQGDLYPKEIIFHGNRWTLDYNPLPVRLAVERLGMQAYRICAEAYNLPYEARLIVNSVEITRIKGVTGWIDIKAPTIPLSPVWYVYPLRKHVSFGVIGEKHYNLLKQRFVVTKIDEEAFPQFPLITSRPLVIMQPYFYSMQRFIDRIARKLPKLKGIIGVDVADSDHISPYAVSLTEYATALIVPSNFSRQSYLNSGVKRPVHVLPHGLEKTWLKTPRLKTTFFSHLAHLKDTENLKLILCYIIHSPYRKGLDLLLQFYNKLKKEYPNILLILKTSGTVGYFSQAPENITGAIENYMSGKILEGWLTEQQKMELFDLCDLFFLSSRGGGFEHPALEALGRGEIVLGAKGGSWEDYLPDWALIPSKKSGQVLPDNPIHDGCGVELNVDKAVDKALEIFNNLDEYKAKVREHIETKIKKEFTWSIIGQKLRKIIMKYLSEETCRK